MSTRVYVICGGFVGWDSWLGVSAGMSLLANQIRALANVSTVDTWSWNNYAGILNSIAAVPRSTKLAIVGYSGGCMATPVITGRVGRPVDLVVGYDPSPPGRVQRLGANVLRCLCYHNQNPMFAGYGGERFRANVQDHPVIETTEISMWHPNVQFSQALHTRTLTAIKQNG